ncbi:MAG: hypothetical protein COX62_05020 [Deltaproteobacteria bacterium CG_4_10_14_0_2_um_filter_43_8]|nr:MAG: hypothetical protein COV43_05520 [Deltaproteobacteria bacterium CG11_big_fil_rev_8_21_14_0_20_42_23]PJA20269.1 MAG: hypothetical protein COX62_05020 [Deltaproteobacteria bacterium CG_4_10_14_0_2_um_filter_43_8]PJC64051.1 MAG: hypothetical protein CO021_06495 [Deltaproteobacteria bacterium CG_4_9_14_0_2_um_filter_42_21]
MPKTVFVTGAGGFIGSHICKLLLEKKIPVIALLHQNETFPSHPLLTCIYGDIRNPLDLKRACKKASFIIHAAAHTALWSPSAEIYFDVNVEGTRNLIRIAREEKIERFLYFSSAMVMGASKNGEKRDESSFCSLASAEGSYERSKYLAEQLILEELSPYIPTTIFRPSAVFGPGDNIHSATQSILRAFLKHKCVFYYNTIINLIDVRDLAAYSVAALFKSSSEALYIAGGENISLRHLLEKMNIVSGEKKFFIHLPYTLLFVLVFCGEHIANILQRTPLARLSFLKAVAKPWRFDSSKLQTHFGIPTHDVETTLKDALHSYQQRMK